MRIETAWKGKTERGRMRGVREKKDGFQLPLRGRKEELKEKRAINRPPHALDLKREC